MELRIGTSGYQYDHWRGVLYPEKGPSMPWFELYAEQFDTVDDRAVREQSAPAGLPHHLDEPATDWVYLRFHVHVPNGSYTAARLRPLARRIEAWMARGLDVYAYFNNDPHGHAVRDAMRLRKVLLSK